ncbi:nuclear transport factor 2 family protein [Amycolatopsis rhabdoformis]|uniref:Nuclear transport factor 2 family protein n=1 Tax=Amycolatopsis rhabdoformis TaxID=1448059 RepID=A0ABZ1IES7_9PSEU|nr:nuclear transport factor 2 family protein [Amycolatopsis rhabdoformis]WSE32246.1 nuclear transport factor 2 family protein [Amycolatopsis rhabdoformis]
MPFSLDEIADRMEIQDRIALYVHAFDEKDFDALDEVFAPDTTFDFTKLGGGTRDWPTMKAYFKKHHNLPRDFHVYANVLIGFAPERTHATTKSKVYNPQGVLHDGKVHGYSLVGTYHDRWHRRPEGWRITARRWELAWIDGDYPFSEPPGANLPAADEL